MWTRWSGGRLEWRQLFDYGLELEKRLTPLNANAFYVQEARRRLDSAALTAPTDASPQTLRDKLNNIASDIHTYAMRTEQLDGLQQTVSKIPVTSQPLASDWQEVLRDLRSELDQMAPPDQASDTTFNDLDDRIKKARVTLREPGPPSPFAEGLADNGNEGVGGLESMFGPAEYVGPLPQARLPSGRIQDNLRESVSVSGRRPGREYGC